MPYIALITSLVYGTSTPVKILRGVAKPALARGTQVDSPLRVKIKGSVRACGVPLDVWESLTGLRYPIGAKAMLNVRETKLERTVIINDGKHCVLQCPVG